ncbi:MAG: hypothetical protein JJU42_07125 [Rhodobacteraceae bacterium]|nr:hypothetical protein [Paracoccaceae bacterium]
MTQNTHFRGAVVALSIPIALAVSALPAMAQNYMGAGEGWSTTYGFPTANDRNVAVQQAQVMRNATQQQGPSTVVYNNTHNDNRSNFVENFQGETSTATIEFQIGDSIGTNTNSVGAMNTGETTITVRGDNNVVDATNAAESRGCIDGSVNSSTLKPLADVGSVGNMEFNQSARSSAPFC